jgi:hypothetical protein
MKHERCSGASARGDGDKMVRRAERSSQGEDDRPAKTRHGKREGPLPLLGILSTITGCTLSAYEVTQPAKNTCFATWPLRSQDHHSCFTIKTTRGAADNAIQREVCNSHQLCTRSVHDNECRRAVKSELERRQTWCNAVSAGISSILGALDGMRIARSAQRSMQGCGCSSLGWQWYYYA